MPEPQTHTTHKGKTVVAEQLAPSPLGNVGGTDVTYKQITQLLLADDTYAYGCAHCPYTADTSQSVASHLKEHNGDIMDMPLRDVLALARRMHKTPVGEDWRKRALEAERRFNQLKELLQ